MDGINWTALMDGIIGNGGHSLTDGINGRHLLDGINGRH